METTVQSADVEKLLQKKRKLRDSKACYPCRLRKVKCDNQVPCETCKTRDHPELCISQPPSKRGRPEEGGEEAAAAAAGRAASEKSGGDDESQGSVAVRHRASLGRAGTQLEEELSRRMASVEGTLAAIQHQLAEISQRLPSAHDPPVVESSQRPEPVKNIRGVHASDSTAGAQVYLGGSSMPAFVLGFNGQHGHAHKSMEESILPIFGLENATGAYPFVTPAIASTILPDLYAALPSNSEINRLFQIYTRIPAPFNPCVADIDEFEQQLCIFFNERANTSSPASDKHDAAEHIAWLGLLFAVLASVGHAFQCLRMTNFLLRPSLNVIQTMLLIGEILQNDINPGMSWTFLGTTIRLAITAGLHRDSLNPHIGSSKDLKRRKIWWVVVSSDSFLSLIYDRPPGVGKLENTTAVPCPPSAAYSYLESSFRICSITVSFLQEPISSLEPAALVARVQNYKAQLAELLAAGQLHLRDMSACRRIPDQLENLALQMQHHFVYSSMLRPLLGVKGEKMEEIRGLQEECIESLTETVRLFLEFAGLSIAATRSWMFLHAALSSGLLLGILGESRNPDVRVLENRLCAVIERLDGVAGPQNSQPLARALAALRNLIQHGTLGGSSEESCGRRSDEKGEEMNEVPASVPLEAPGPVYGQPDVMYDGGMYFDSSEFSAPNELLNSILYGPHDLTNFGETGFSFGA